MCAGETRETVDMMSGLAVLVEQYLGKQSRAAVRERGRGTDTAACTDFIESGHLAACIALGIVSTHREVWLVSRITLLLVFVTSIHHPWLYTLTPNLVTPFPCIPSPPSLPLPPDPPLPSLLTSPPLLTPHLTPPL